MRERREDHRLIGWSDADAGIRHGDVQDHRVVGFSSPRVRVGRLHRTVFEFRPTRFDTDIDHDLAAFGEFDGIAHQIEDDLPQPASVPEQELGDFIVDMTGQFQSLLVCPQRKCLDRSVERLTEAEGGQFQFELPRLHARKVQNVVEQKHQGVRRFLGRPEIVAHHGRQFLAEAKLQHAEHGIHRRAQLVAHVGQKVALGAVRGDRRILRLTQFLFGLFAARDVSFDGRDTDQPSRGIMNGREGQRDRYELSTATSAHRLELIQPSATSHGRPQFGFNFRIVGGKNDRDRPADGFLRSVAIDHFGGPVPARDDAIQRLAHDRVVGGIDDGRKSRLLLQRPPALDDAPHLFADVSRQAEQVCVGSQFFRSEELHDGNDFVTNQDRKSKRSFDAEVGALSGLRKVVISFDVLDQRGAA